MKRIFLLCTAALVLLLVLTGCNTETLGEPTDTVTGEATERSTEEKKAMDNSKFNIFFDKNYICAVVIPAEPSPIEEMVIGELETAIMGQTGKVLSFVSDSESTDGYDNVILVGNTKHRESKDAYTALSANTASAEVKGNKLIIAFSGLSAGKGIVKSLSNALRADVYGTARLEADYKESYTSMLEDGSAPKFEYATGSMDCGADTNMKYFAISSVVEFESYCVELLDTGFEKISEREEKGNLFATFTKGDKYYYVYYTRSTNDIRMISGDISTLAAADYTEELECDKEPYIASIPQPAMGQGYILRLPDGRYLIHDGGYEGDDRVYKALRKLQPEGDIVIAAWFISHPHGDHYPAFIDFIRDHAKDSDIRLERLIYNYAPPERHNITGTAGVEVGGPAITKFYEDVKKYMPELPMIKAHTGQVMDFGSATVEVLFTVEDILPKDMNNTNNSSMVLRVEMGGSSIMLLADTSYMSGPILNNMWGDYLKSDIVQIAHHGMWPSVADIYHSIEGEVVLFSSMYSLVRDHIKSDTKWADVMNVILDYAKDIYVSDAQGEVIMLPYIAKNNKEAQLEYIKNR